MENQSVICRSAMRLFQAETTAEQDFIVPDIKPDIKKVLKLTATPILHQSDYGQGRLTLSGDLMVYLCYLPEDGLTARGMELRLPFSDVLETGGDGCVPEVQVRRLTCNLINGRKISLRAQLSVNCFCSQTEEVTLLCPDEDDDLRVLKKPFSYCKTVVTEPRTVEFSERLELPSQSAPVRELLSVEPTVLIQEYQALTDRIALSGVVRVETLYLPDTDPCHIARMEHELPFTEIIRADGLNEDAYCQIAVLPCRFEVGLCEDSDGDARMVSLRYGFRLVADACNTETCDAVTDAFGISRPVTLKNASLKAVCNCQRRTLTHNIREVLPIESVLEVCSLTAVARVVSTAKEESVLTLNGELTVNALVLCEPDGLPEAVTATLPFTAVDDGGCHCDEVCATAVCEHAGYTLRADGGVELRATVKLTVTGAASETVAVVTQLTPCEAAQEKPCRMVVYFPQEKDCLWDVAKRYGCCPKKIATVNGLEETCESLPHQPILIP